MIINYRVFNSGHVWNLEHYVQIMDSKVIHKQSIRTRRRINKVKDSISNAAN